MKAKRFEMEIDSYLMHLIKSEMMMSGCMHPMDIFDEIKKEIPLLRERRFMRVFKRAARID